MKMPYYYSRRRRRKRGERREDLTGLAACDAIIAYPLLNAAQILTLNDIAVHSKYLILWRRRSRREMLAAELRKPAAYASRLIKASIMYLFYFAVASK